MRSRFMLVFLCLCTLQARAEGIALGVHAGLMGAGVDAFYRLNDVLVLHGIYNRTDTSFDDSFEDLDYDATLGFDNGQLGLDWYPFAGSFRVAFAYVANGNEIAAHAIPKDGQFTFNGNSYPAIFVDDAGASASYSGPGAYFGLGWGNPVSHGKGLGFTADIGVVYTGRTDINMNIDCAAITPAPQCAQIKSDAEVERRKKEDELADVPFWPLLQVGATYQF